MDVSGALNDIVAAWKTNLQGTLKELQCRELAKLFF